MEEFDVSIRRNEPMVSETMVRAPMSYEEYRALPEDIWAEYVDGVALMTPPAGPRHNRTARWTAQAIEEACPALFVATESGLATRPSRLRIPDVYALAQPESAVFTEQVPVVVVEVLSPSTRTEDTLRKSHEYADRGVGQYWIIDPEHRQITVLVNDGQGWEIARELTDAEPLAVVEIGEYGTVELDLTRLLRD